MLLGSSLSRNNSHSVPYVFFLARSPWKTNKTISLVLENLKSVCCKCKYVLNYDKTHMKIICKLKIPWNKLLLGFAVSQPFIQISSRKPVLMKDGGTHCEIIIISKKPRVLIIILHIIFLIASKLKILTTKNLMLASVKTALNLPQSVLEPPIGGALWINTPRSQVV